MNDNPQSLEPLLEMNARDRAERADGRAVAARLPEEPDEPPRVAPSRAKKT